jgi:hypothetical protein
MSGPDGSLLARCWLAREVHPLTWLCLQVTAGLFVVGYAGPCLAQASPMDSEPAIAATSPLSMGTDSSSCLSASPNSSLPIFDGGGLSVLSGITVGSGEPTSGIYGGSTGVSGIPAASGMSTSGTRNAFNVCGSTPSSTTSSSGSPSTLAFDSSALGTTQPGNPTGPTSIAPSPDVFPSAPCIGTDTPSMVAPSLRSTLNSTGSAGFSSPSTETASAGPIPGSRITGMGGTGEIPDSLAATSDAGISDYPTGCGGGPLGVMQRNLMTSTTMLVPSATNPMASMSSGATLSSSSGME